MKNIYLITMAAIYITVLFLTIIHTHVAYNKGYLDGYLQGVVDMPKVPEKLCY